jgi:integrase
VSRPIKFPHTLENRYGKVSIYKTRNGKYTSYKIVWQEGSNRRKESSPSEARAVARAEEILSDLSASGVARKGATTAQWAYYQQCEALLPEGVTLREVVENYLKSTPTPAAPIPLAEIVKQFLESKEKAGCSKKYVTMLRLQLEPLVPHLNPNINKVTAVDLDYFLHQIPHPRTRKNWRASVISCWAWAKSKGFLTTGPSAAEHTDIPTVPNKDPEIITPEVLKAAFTKVPAELIPALAIAAFAGVRTAEILRMTWEEDVAVDAGLIVLKSNITKTNRRRVVEMEPCLVAWLKAHKGTGKIVPYSQSKFTRLMAQAKGDTPWPHNALRHSAVSYLMALHRDAAMVAEQCGHTVAQLQTSYKAAVTRATAEEWFGIFP